MCHDMQSRSYRGRCMCLGSRGGSIEGVVFVLAAEEEERGALNVSWQQRRKNRGEALFVLDCFVTTSYYGN